MMEFTNKNVLVTGASRGIGRVIAKQFAENGAKVIVHYNKNQTSAAETMASLVGEGHILVQADISDPSEVKQLVDTSIAKMGKIDVLVNNAGVFFHHPNTEVSYDEWQNAWNKTIGTNLMGPANIMYCIANHMKENGGGRIVNVSSRGAFRGEPNAPAYGASKAGLNAMSQSMAKAMAPYNVFIYIVAPGFVQTEMVEDILTGKSGEEVKKQSPLNRVARPEEIAKTVLFLASEGTDFLTGCIVDINGASYLRS